MSRALFITGTGTDIGKTYVTGLIVKKLAEHNGKNALKAVVDYSVVFNECLKIYEIRWLEVFRLVKPADIVVKR